MLGIRVSLHVAQNNRVKPKRFDRREILCDLKLSQGVAEASGLPECYHASIGK